MWLFRNRKLLLFPTVKYKKLRETNNALSKVPRWGLRKGIMFCFCITIILILCYTRLHNQQTEMYGTMKASMVVSSFTMVPINEVLQHIKEHYLTTTNFQRNNENCEQTDGVAMDSILGQVIANFFLEIFEQRAPDTAGKNVVLIMLRYVGDTFVICGHGKGVQTSPKYLLNTSTCRIPDIDPFIDEVLPFVFKMEYIPCRSVGLLTYIDKTEGLPFLKINSSLIPSYSSYFGISCCYSNITRTNFETKSDNKVAYSSCVYFEDAVQIFHPFIRVQCSTILRKVYVNTHAVILPVDNKKEEFNSGKFSVLFVGIDSISKLNLVRTMPLTHSYLEKHFISLAGYNKIGLNTFPNLMAILTGRNMRELDKMCNNSVKLNTCGLIWEEFKSSKYMTAYAEDDSRISTFNYDRPGFLNPPTDYYYNPYIIASEEISTKFVGAMTYCAGPETSGERIINAAKDFAITYKKKPVFGLFWTNSFSHDNINLPSSMDKIFYNFLSDPILISSLQNTIMVFLSDHGFRFGNIRYTQTGWLEERLPFVYFYIPQSFRKQYPEKYNNFLINTHRLTSPYDVYVTLQELLEFGNQTHKAKASLGCPACKSLFQIIEENRTCVDAGIVDQWCTCAGHTYINPTEDFIQLIGKFVVDTINNMTRVFPENYLCSKFDFVQVVSAAVSKCSSNGKNETNLNVRVMVQTTPSALFETTVDVKELHSQHYKLSGVINRITQYGPNSFCVANKVLKEYCYCKMFKIVDFFCSIFKIC